MDGAILKVQQALAAEVGVSPNALNTSAAIAATLVPGTIDAYRLAGLAGGLAGWLLEINGLNDNKKKEKDSSKEPHARSACSPICPLTRSQTSSQGYPCHRTP